MAGTIMPIGFRINPWSVFCLVCKGEAARSLDALPHCARCGGSYCQNCMTRGEPSLRCAGDPDNCPLGLHAPDPPAAA
jgi:hypothetical protein